MTEADLIAERDACMGIAQGPVPRDMLKDRSRRHHAQRAISNRVRSGWTREEAETVPLGQKRGPKPLPPEERAARDRARWRARYAEQKAKRAQRAPEGPDADPM